MEKKKSFFERRPYVCYALYAGLLFAFNLFLRWWSFFILVYRKA